MENREARFETAFDGRSPFTVRWYKGDEVIVEERVAPGSSSISFAPGLIDGGVAVRAEVENELGLDSSDAAVLTVTADTEPPDVIGIEAPAGGHNDVRVEFDERLDLNSATALSSYSIDGLESWTR